VIVGDTTYGKSSGQQFIPLDERRPNSGGDIKVTMQKYYRITGNTYQRQGVVPDVVLPTLLRAWIPREKDAEEALSNDQIDKELNYRSSPALPLEQLAKKSRERLEADKQFSQLKLSSDSLFTDLSKTETIPLDVEGYFAYRQQLRKNMEHIMRLEERKANLFETKNNRFAESLVQMSEIQRLNHESLIAEIQQDIYIAETFQVMLDLIKSK
jgi:carboxyl-terminal processing protease